MKNKGSILWEKAKTIIPGGNQLLSKRSERFLPGLWPSYYSRAKGCEVWDLNGNHYYDFAGMGVGSCILGYADDEVNAAVIKAVTEGSMSSLNSYEEIDLAEKLIALHPWADMVRFARTGGEACSIAVRIARAAAGRNKVAFCGYHGWHDWYLSSNLGNEANLDNQLLPGLKPLGVPRELRETAIPFNYNNIDELKTIIDKYGNEIGVIIMEPMRSTYPRNNFLHEVRAIANKIGAVLIFDEVSLGFRMNLGGLHMYLGVEPDIAVFGKALGNGFPIAAIIGRRNVMDSAQDTFISSTFWTERIGFTAALATLNKMEKEQVQSRLIELGDRIIAGWQKLADQHGLKIHVGGVPPFCHITFETRQAQEAQTLYTQEMLARGYLVAAAVAVTYAYSEKIIDQFISDSSEVFGKIAQALKDGDVKKYLKGEVIDPGFKRLT
jgi:glutamate-1-semialdehyde 2,1-aminomutase